MYTSVFGFFHPILYLVDSFMLMYIIVVFLLNFCLFSILLYEYITIFNKIIFGTPFNCFHLVLLGIKLLQLFLFMFFCDYMCTFLLNIYLRVNFTCSCLGPTASLSKSLGIYIGMICKIDFSTSLPTLHSGVLIKWPLGGKPLICSVCQFWWCTHPTIVNFRNCFI